MKEKIEEKIDRLQLDVFWASKQGRLYRATDNTVFTVRQNEHVKIVDAKVAWFSSNVVITIQSADGKKTALTIARFLKDFKKTTKLMPKADVIEKDPLSI
jgi:hypothetical protein